MTQYMQMRAKKEQLQNDLKKEKQRNYYFKSQIKKLRENQESEKEHNPRFLLLERDYTNKYTIRSID